MMVTSQKNMVEIYNMKLFSIRKILITLALPLLLVTFFESHAAVAPKVGSILDGEGIFWFTDTGEQAPVRFNHFGHQAQNPDCRICHDILFKMERSSTDINNLLNSKSMADGKYCGACHNGERTFSVKDNCAACHKKPTEP